MIFLCIKGKEEDFFVKHLRLEDCMSLLRLNFYPFLDNIDAVDVAPDGTRLASEAHRDSVLFTVLYQPIEGLQAEIDGEWVDVPPSKTNFILHVLQI